MAGLDKFYTNRTIAKKCVESLYSVLPIKKTDRFLEPTAGDGAFLDFLPNFEAYDLEPEDPRIHKQDIFNFKPDRRDYVTIGNPPFGKRSRLAISVFNVVADYSDVIAFIVPVSFLKYNVQFQLDVNFKLVHNFMLPENSFFDNGKPYDVNCVFQIWVRKKTKFDTSLPDLRLYKRPSINNKDFKIWQYNATEAAFNTVNEDWEIAVYRQGYKDYSIRYTQADKQQIKAEMEGTATGKKVQFFFIKPLTKQARAIIRKMDFARLANMNTKTPGFGKADFVAYYEEIKRGNMKSKMQLLDEINQDNLW